MQHPGKHVRAAQRAGLGSTISWQLEEPTPLGSGMASVFSHPPHPVGKLVRVTQVFCMCACLYAVFVSLCFFLFLSTPSWEYEITRANLLWRMSG